MRFPRSARITQGAELLRIMREGKRVRTTYLEVRIDVSPLAFSGSQNTVTRLRVGIIVPRQKRSAVERNRLKRRLRELVRLHILPMEILAALVLRIRTGAYEAPFEALLMDIMQVKVRLEEIASKYSAPPVLEEER